MSLLRELSAEFVSGSHEVITKHLEAQDADIEELVVDQLDAGNLVVDTLLAHNLIKLQNPADPAHVITLDPTLPSITLTDGLNTNIITSIGGGGGGGDADQLLLNDATVSASTFYPTFALTNTNYQPQYAATNLSYVPSTATLTCANFAGNASSATSAGTATSANTVLNTGGVSTNAVFYPSFFGANTSTSQGPQTSAALTLNPGTATLTCTNFAGNASTASAVSNTGGVTTNSTFFPSFMATNTSTNQGTRTSAALSFNPGTATLTCTNFAGTATAAASASAVSNTGGVSTNATFYPAFLAANSTSNQATNTATGLTFNPSTSLVTVSGTTLGGSANPQLRVTNSNTTAGTDTGTVVEVYRSNVANGSDETGRLQFAMRDATSTKRISGAIKSIPYATNPVYSDMVFSVSSANTLTDFMNVSGANDNVNFYKTANFAGGATIINVDSITTTTNCRYAPQLLQGFQRFTETVPFPGPITDHTLRLYSQGIDSTVRLQTFPGSPSVKVYDSVEFYSNVTATTNVYFACDDGVWYYDGIAVTQLVRLDGRALCMLLFDNQILVGGEFTQDVATAAVYSHMLLIDANHTLSQMVWANLPADEGVSGNTVNALATDGAGWLYFGGKFNKTNGGNLALSNFGICNSSGAGIYNAYAIDDNSASTNGIGGVVNSIALDPVVGKTRLIIGGDFIGTQCSPGGVSTSTVDQYATVWYNLGDQNSDPAAGNPSGVPFQYVGSSPASFNSTVYVVAARATDVYFGGRATNIDGLGVNYLVYADAGVYDTVYDGNPGGVYGSAVSALTYQVLPSGTYWWVGLDNGEFYINDVYLATAVFAQANRVVWTPSYAVFLIESDNPTVYSYNPSNVTTLGFGDGQTLSVYPDLTYTNGINLLNKGAYVDLQYLGGADYLLVGSQGATFF